MPEDCEFVNNPGYPVDIQEHRISGLMYPEVDQGRTRTGLVFLVGGRGNTRSQLMLENLIYASAFRHLGTGKPLEINQSICKSIFFCGNQFYPSVLISCSKMLLVKLLLTKLFNDFRLKKNKHGQFTAVALSIFYSKHEKKYLSGKVVNLT